MNQNNVSKSTLLDFDWLIWLLAMMCVWIGLGSYGVLNNNEGLYAYIPFDMLYSGDVTHWIIPHLNGLPYMEKPPMLYWLTAFAFFVFGESEWVVRLIPTLSGLACVGLMLYFGRHIHRPRMARLAALMFISGVGVMVLTRTLVFDVLFTVFLTAAILFAYLFQLDGRKTGLRIAYASLACAVLTKGFAAIILFGLVLSPWMIFVRRDRWKQFSKWFDPLAVSLFFIITIPWLVAATLTEPVFAWFFFVNEHVLRFLGQRMPHDYYSGPWWYYLPRMILYFFPWSLLVPVALYLAKLKPSEELFTLRRMFFWGWFAPLLFFSISNAKANYYLVVAMPFATLHLALLLEQSHFLAGKKSLLLGVAVALITATLAITLQFFSNPHSPASFAAKIAESELVIFTMPMLKFVLITLWSLTGLSLASALIAWRFLRIGLVAYVTIPLFLLGALLAVMNVKEASLSDQAVAQFIQQTLPGRTVYSWRRFEQNSSLAFYLKTPLKIIDSNSNDLYWGAKLRPENTIMVSSEQFERNNQPVVVVVSNEYVGEFRQAHPGFSHTENFSRVTLFY